MLRPPIVEASIFIKGSAIGIKSMRNLMGDDRSDTTVIG